MRPRVVDKPVEMVEKPCFDGRLGENSLGMFAKQPVPGQVKTRLCPPLTPDQAAGLYAAALQESVARLQQPAWQLAIIYAGERDYFSARFPGIPLLPQSEGDLGVRLQAAFAALRGAGASKVAMVGSDTPDLPLTIVEGAFAALGDSDLALAPAADGGYVLLGIRGDQPELFRDIPWSSEAVLSTTLARAAALQLAVRQLAGWEDLDDAAALQRLLQRSPESATARYAREELGVVPASSSSRTGCRSASRV